MRITVFGATGGTGRQIAHLALEAGHEVVAAVRDPTRLPPPLARRVEIVVLGASGTAAPGSADVGGRDAEAAPRAAVAGGGGRGAEAESRTAGAGGGRGADVDSRIAGAGVDSRIAGAGRGADVNSRIAGAGGADAARCARVTDGSTVSGEAAMRAAVRGSDAVINVVGVRELRRPTVAVSDITRRVIATAGSGTRLIVASNSAMSPGPGDDPLTRYVVKPLILRPMLRHMIDDMRRAERLVRASPLPWVIVRAGRLTDRPGRGGYRRAVDRNVFGGFQITRTDFAAALLDAATSPATRDVVISVAN